MNIEIKQVKKIREDLNLDSIVIWGVDNNGDIHIATHGKTTEDAKAAAHNGNALKEIFHWPKKDCNAQPLRRVCENCDYWRRKGYHFQDPDSGVVKGDCYLNPTIVSRTDGDRACKEFEPNC